MKKQWINRLEIAEDIRDGTMGSQGNSSLLTGKNSEEWARGTPKHGYAEGGRRFFYGDDNFKSAHMWTQVHMYVLCIFL